MEGTLLDTDVSAYVQCGVDHLCAADRRGLRLGHPVMADCTQIRRG